MLALFFAKANSNYYHYLLIYVYCLLTIGRLNFGFNSFCCGSQPVEAMLSHTLLRIEQCINKKGI